MSGTRLNKYIASSGLCSRRKADELIESGVVVVNGKKISEPGYLVQQKDKVFVNNKLIHPVKHEYYRFYKPAGYITTADDEKGRKTIYDLLPENLHHLKPVGRLDKDSTGLLILTNDGDLINALSHPSVKVPKIYRVTINGKITQNDIDTIHTVMEIVLYQGLNRQIRKMFEHLGHEVISLKRTQHAILNLDGLKRGEYKPVKPGQIKDLKNFLNRITNKND